MKNDDPIPSVTSNYLHRAHVAIEANDKYFILPRHFPSLLSYEIIPRIQYVFFGQSMLQSMVMYNNFDHSVLLSLNEIIMQGERRGNNSRQALPR